MMRLTLGVLLACSVFGAAHCGEIADLARQAEAKADAGQHVEAVELLRRAQVALAARAPLAFRRVEFVSEQPGGFGMFKPRGSNVFRQGEPLIVYTEPVGVGWKSEGDRLHSLVIFDFTVRTRDGQVLGGRKDFGRLAFTSQVENQEIMAHLTIRLSGAPAGQYVLEVTFRDQVANKSAELELPFAIE